MLKNSRYASGEAFGAYCPSRREERMGCQYRAGGFGKWQQGQYFYLY